MLWVQMNYITYSNYITYFKLFFETTVTKIVTYFTNSAPQKIKQPPWILDMLVLGNLDATILGNR